MCPVTNKPFLGSCDVSCSCFCFFVLYRLGSPHNKLVKLCNLQVAESKGEAQHCYCWQRPVPYQSSLLVLGIRMRGRVSARIYQLIQQ